MTALSFYTFVDNHASFSYITVVMKHFTSQIFLVLFFFGNGSAQVTVSASAMGTFAVLGYSTVTRLSDLNFGDLIVGTNVTVLPTDPRAAEFMFNGNNNTVVQVTLTYPATLTSGSNTMRFFEINAVQNIIPDAATAVEFKKKSGGSASTGPDGDLYIWVGGRVVVGPNQAAGSYTGIMQIVVVQP
jgi:hypothetical protein